MKFNPPRTLIHGLLTAVLWAGLATPPGVSAHADHGKPMHGGVVAEAGLFQGEWVVKDRNMTLYITNHGEPVPMEGGSAKATLISGQTQTEVVFAHAGGNRLTATLAQPLSRDSKAVVTVKLPNGRSAALRFSWP